MSNREQAMNQALVLHPESVIVHRSGDVVLARLSGTAPPMSIGPADVVLLANFLTPGPPERAVRAVAGGELARYLPGVPTAEQAAGRIREFQRRGVLAAPRDLPGAAGRHSRAGAMPIDSRHAGKTIPKGRLRPTRNFLLRPAPAGFEVYSARDGREHRLDLESALILLAFAGGRGVAEAAAMARPDGGAGRVAAVAAWLAERGILVPVGEGAAAAGDYRKDVPVHRANAPDWRELDPDGRIPVYFMPHMENHFPLALGMIYSALESWRDGALLERFQLIPISYLPPQAFLEGPYRKFGPGVWLFSNYMWSVELNLKMSSAVKLHDAGNLTIHGGPSTPAYEKACEEFMARHRSVDIAVHGEGEVATCRVLDAVERDSPGALRAGVGMKEIEGLTYRVPGGGRRDLVRTAPRLRMNEPDIVPSPYTGGVFDAYEARVEAAIVETNRGCPFKCTFCDWGSATNQKVTRFELERIGDELEWIGAHRIGVLWIADANFGMLKRDLEIARCIVDVKRRRGFPREVVVNYTKNANDRLAEIIKVFTEGGIISQGIISIQTTDEKTLEIIDRKNIKTEKYDHLIEVFSDLGLPLSTDLMIGLPGITPEAFDRDLQRYIDVDVSVKAYPTQLLPNSPMAHPAYMKKYRIEVDGNGFLVSCASYTAAELKAMRQIYHVYTVADGYATLRHVMRFLQWEHGIRAMDFLHHLTGLAQNEPGRYPAITWVLRYFSDGKVMPGGWRRFFDEIAAFTRARYGVARDSAFDTVLEVNEAMMPDEAREYPMTLALEHDYASYFTARNRLHAVPAKPLSEYPPGELTVSDPNRMAGIDFEYQQYDTHQFFWELSSPVSRPKSIAEAANGRPRPAAEAT